MLNRMLFIRSKLSRTKAFLVGFTLSCKFCEIFKNHIFQRRSLGSNLSTEQFARWYSLNIAFLVIMWLYYFNIPAMIWKHPIFKNELLTFCTEVLNKILLSVFSKATMFATPKKGDLKLPSNLRGINLPAIFAKIYNSVLLSRRSEHIEPILRRNVFRKGRLTLPEILAFRRIIEEIRASSRNSTLVFIDFLKRSIALTERLCFVNCPCMVSFWKL